MAAEKMVEFDERPRTLADGFCFTECPRWRDGWLYFSDMYGRTVYRVDEAGTLETIVRVESRPGGLGWLPNGDMLIAGMDEGRVLRLSQGQLHVHADLTSVARTGINDMVVDAQGRAYVAKFLHQSPPPEEPIIIVEPDGRWYESEHRLRVANGMILTGDGKQLIVAESAGMRLTRFDLDADGVPTNPEIFAQLDNGQYPDGICGDDQGGAWVTTALGPGVFRVEAGSRKTHYIPYENGRFSYACALGGADGQTLFICTADRYTPATMHEQSSAAIEVLKVPFKRSGTP